MQTSSDEIFIQKRLCCRRFSVKIVKLNELYYRTPLEDCLCINTNMINNNRPKLFQLFLAIEQNICQAFFQSLPNQFCDTRLGRDLGTIPANICWSSRHVLKTFSTRLQRNNFTSSKTSCEDVLKTFSKPLARRLQDVLEDEKLLR